MKGTITTLMLMLSIGAAAMTQAPKQNCDTKGSQEIIVKTDAYSWQADTIFQGPFKAWAENGEHIISTYAAQPHYYMPIEKEWRRKNDLSAYPQLTTPNTLHTAIYNLGLDEMVNAVEPDTTLRTGAAWGGVWTRDVSYSIILSMAYMQPLASEISLRKKVNAAGRIVQDTGSGGAWPVSTDRMIWAVAAYELYKVTGDKQWLQFAYPVIKNSIDDDIHVAHTGGLVKGETSFIDWREQSYPRWMQTADIYQSEALGTNVVHAVAMEVLSKMADELGEKDAAKEYAKRSEDLKNAINDELWMEDKGYYAMYKYGRNSMILNRRAETLGEALSILYDIAPQSRQKAITENNPTTKYGAAIFYPQIADMPSYHNNALWPWVGAMWALANAKVGNEEGTLEAIGSVFRPAALFCTNKENFNLSNGDIATELNSSNMLWCLSGNLALTYRILFGIHFEDKGLEFKPFVPKALAGDRKLEGFKYRDAMIDIAISGYGDRIESFKLDGKEASAILPTNIKGRHSIEIQMSNCDIKPMKVNRVENKKAPLTPISRFEFDSFCWNPIEYSHHYVVLRDGNRIATTRQTSFPATPQGEYQVIAVNDDGTESFASEPISNKALFCIEMPLETKEMRSKEISYAPIEPVAGFNGTGFIEIDHESKPVRIKFNVPKDGEYVLSLRYANGNGPVNTENKCAIRTLTIDGQKVGIFVLPQRGEANWNDWGSSNKIGSHLTAGTHTLSLEFRPENENMNLKTNHALIDRIVIQEN